MDRSGESEGHGEVERKAYYGGRVEYWSHVSKRGVILNWLNFGFCSIALVVSIVAYGQIWINVVIVGLTFAAAIFWQLRYHEQVKKRRQIAYYDVHSTYPKSVMEPDPGDVTSGPMPWWICKGCGNRYPMTTNEPYYSSEYCAYACKEEKR